MFDVSDEGINLGTFVENFGYNLEGCIANEVIDGSEEGIDGHPDGENGGSSIGSFG